MQKKNWKACTLFICLLSLLAAADVKLPAIFGDNMVLQQKARAAVWGWADPGEKIIVKGSWQFLGVTCRADQDGRWMVKINTPAAGGPHTLTVQGKNKITLNQILSGEVWVCSGQSNMQWSVAASDNAKEEIAEADYPKIRLFTVKKAFNAAPRQDCQGQWQMCSPATVESFSAAGYFFGRQLHQKLNVPVGLIFTSWGGTPAEAWTSEKVLREQFPEFAPIIDRFKSPETVREQTDPGYSTQMSQWEQSIGKIDPGTQQNWQDAKQDTADWKEMELPGVWKSPDLQSLDGIVWFRRTTVLPPSWAKATMELHLGPIDDADTLWVNGVRIGSTSGSGKNRVYTIPPSALRVGPNVIAVRVVDFSGSGGFTGVPEDMLIGPVGADIKTSANVAATWKYKVSLAGVPVPPAPSVSNGKLNHRTPTALFNGMVSPLIPFQIAGAIWYQGESNVDRHDQYAKLFPAMITDWRKCWGIGDFPFYYVQIAPYSYKDSTASNSTLLRDVQTKTLAAIPNVGMASAIDIGVEKNIHPTNKQEVGRRLSVLALAEHYGLKDIVFCGPMYKSMKIEGDKIRILFDNAQDGLVAKGGDLTDFVIAGSDSKFVPAKAVIENNTVVVSSEQIREPAAVRFAWKNWTCPNLYNKAGLPANQFATDGGDKMDDNATTAELYKDKK